MKTKARIFLQAAVIVAAGLWIYAPALHGGWLWDDNTNLTENPLMRDPAALWKIWFAPQSLDYYPIQMSVEWIQWQLWGVDTFGYHLTNVCLQIVDALLFWWVLAGAAKTSPGRRPTAGVEGPRVEGWADPAFLGGLLFIVHPMTVESVAWIVELKNTLSLAFLLLAMISWMDWFRRDEGGNLKPEIRSKLSSSERGTGFQPVSIDNMGWKPTPRHFGFQVSSFILRRRSYIFSLLCFVAAMLSKSSVVMFPVILLLYAWWRRGRVGRRDLVATAPFFLVSLALGLVTIWLQQHRVIQAAVIPVGGVLSRLAVAGLAPAFYLWKFLVPVNLMPIYPRWDVDPPSALQFLPWVAILGLGWWLWQTRRRGALFGLGVFFVNLLPVTGAVTVATMRFTWVMDHFAYVSLLGLIGLASAAAAEAESGMRKANTRPASSWFPLFAFRFSLFLLLAALAVSSRGYAKTFAGGRVFWAAAVARNPAAWPAQYNLALALLEAGQFPAAIDHLEAAVRLNPDYPAAEVNLANALGQSGRDAEALPHYTRALQLDPGNAVAHYNYGLTLRALGRAGEAREQFRTAARLLHP